MFRFLCLAFLLFSLAACGEAVSSAHFQPPPKPGGRLCILQCSEAKEHCADECSLDERACSNKMQAQAIHDYESYAREQFAAHQPLEFMPRDFERPQKCKPVACLSRCEEAYRSCYLDCGGKIETQSSCQAFCF